MKQESKNELGLRATFIELSYPTEKDLHLDSKVKMVILVSWNR
jgi:hypothetical protein